ncbi:MAG TPA: C45 family peptidase [Streptosporangiaceae bacterium]|nr:C45 family peptidase [Streptosporangiaceae bacterium]
MTVTLNEQRLGALRWIVLSGPEAEAFGALGRHLRAEIRAVVSEWDYLDRLRQHVAGPPGRGRLAAVSRASQTAFPEVWAELAALAGGAGVPLGDLALLNFRGDLGIVGEGGGCSDLAWRRRESFIAHNEDDSEFFDGRSALLTLALDGRPAVTAFWKPGFLPSTTFTVTGTGLVWAIDHLPVAAPGAGPGRHFIARGLQRSAGTLDQAIRYLRDHPSAGGFAYIIGDRSGRIVTVEALAGRYASREVGQGPGGPLAWHTNHGRYLAGADADSRGTSLARGEILQAVDVPAGEPDAAWFARILAGAAPPDGVRADFSPGHPGMTLCTLVANLTTGEAALLGRGAEAVTIPLAGLVQGKAGIRQTAGMPSLA